MPYSSIIEIIGIKELAEDQPSEFLHLTNHFKQAIESTLELFVLPEINNEEFKIHIFRDYCYAETEKLRNMYIFLKKLREQFFETDSKLFRAVIIQGALEIVKAGERKLRNERTNVGANIRSTGFGQIPSKLYGILERFKGVGILIHEGIIESNSNEIEEFKTNVFHNYYVTTIGNRGFQPKFQSYFDVRIESSDEFHAKTSEVLKIILEARFISKKLARFYIPFLINLAKTVPFEEGSEGVISIIGTARLNKCKDISGIELFYLALLDRLYGRERIIDRASELITKISIELSKITWLVDILRNDSSYSNIPKEIISNSTRRLALREIATLTT